MIMSKSIRLLPFAALVFAATIRSGYAATQVIGDDAEVVAYKEALRSQSSTQISHAAEQLFWMAGEDDVITQDDLSKMVLHSDHEVALAAAWWRVKAAFHFRPEMRDYRETLKAEIARFAGNVEARLRVSVAKAWIDRLNAMSFQSDIDLVGGDSPINVTWSFPVWAAPEIAHPPAEVFTYAEEFGFWKQPWVNVSVVDTPDRQSRNTQYLVVHPRLRWQLPLSPRRRSVYSICAAFANDSGVAAAHVAPPKESATYDLVIWHNPNNGRNCQCAWVSRRLVDGGIVLGDKMDHWGIPAFSKDKQQVVVFGVNSRVIYVEAFDVATGALTMSFRDYN